MTRLLRALYKIQLSSLCYTLWYTFTVFFVQLVPVWYPLRRIGIFHENGQVVSFSSHCHVGPPRVFLVYVLCSGCSWLCSRLLFASYCATLKWFCSGHPMRLQWHLWINTPEPFFRNYHIQRVYCMTRSKFTTHLRWVNEKAVYPTTWNVSCVSGWPWQPNQAIGRPSFV